MSLADDSNVWVVVADYAAADQAGKLNIIGGAFQLVGTTPSGQLLTPLAVMVVLEVPRKYAGEDCALTLELRNETTGEAAKVPTPDGSMETLRVAQNIPISVPAVPGISVPPDVPCRVNFAMQIAPGLPLQPNNAYAWRVSLDGKHRKGWEAKFWTVSGPTPPVFGGPSGPADIPQVSLS